MCNFWVGVNSHLPLILPLFLSTLNQYVSISSTHNCCLQLSLLISLWMFLFCSHCESLFLYLLYISNRFFSQNVTFTSVLLLFHLVYLPFAWIVWSFFFFFSVLLEILNTQNHNETLYTLKFQIYIRYTKDVA